MPVSPVKKSLMKGTKTTGPAPVKGNRQVETGKANPPAVNQLVAFHRKMFKIAWEFSA